MFCARVLAMNWLGLKTFQGCCVIAHINGEILFCSTFYTCVCNKKIRPSGSREKPISRMLPREYRDLPLCFFEHSVIQMSVMMGWLRSRLRVIAPTWSCSSSHSAFLSLSTRERKCMIVLLNLIYIHLRPQACSGTRTATRSCGVWLERSWPWDGHQMDSSWNGPPLGAGEGLQALILNFPTLFK